MVLNIFGQKEVAKFKKEFYEKEFEMLVLTTEKSGYGGLKRGNYLQAVVRFAASINLETGEISDKPGRLEWLNKCNNAGKVVYNIEKYKIYQVKVRKCKENLLEKGQSEIFNNRYMIIKIIKEISNDEKLDKIKQELLKPVTIKNSLGEFNLNRDYSEFEGEINWLSGKCNVHLNTDTQMGITANSSIEILNRIVIDIENLDIKIRKFASEKLSSLANEWSEDSTTKITNEEFMRRLVLEDIYINSEEDEINFWFKDDDMFCGHMVVVYMTSNFNFVDATIEG